MENKVIVKVFFDFKAKKFIAKKVDTISNGHYQRRIRNQCNAFWEAFELMDSEIGSINLIEDNVLPKNLLSFFYLCDNTIVANTFIVEVKRNG